MKSRLFWTAVVVCMLTVPGAAQSLPGYLDVETVNVKPEKAMEFEALTKKFVDANRKNQGDTWLTLQSVYGEGNVVEFVSYRGSFADAEKAYDVFYTALNKSLGPAGARKLLQDFSNFSSSTRSEIRRRRWDLSSNPPADREAYAKLVGQARWVLTTVVHVKPGQTLNFEAEVKELKAVRERETPSQTTLVSQAIAGQRGTAYYFSSLRSSMADFDSITPLSQLLGDEGYRKFLSAAAETVANTEVRIYRFAPEMSNPPEDVVAVAPDYWRPKPLAAAKAKPKAEEGAKEKQ
jgi:hypothetical protein